MPKGTVTCNNNSVALDRYTDGVGVQMMVVTQAPTAVEPDDVQDVRDIADLFAILRMLK